MSWEKEYAKRYEQGGKLLQQLLSSQGPGELGVLALADAKNAIALFERCVAIKDDSWPSMWALGKLYQLLGEHAASLEWMERALKHAASHPDVLRELSIEAMALGESGKAEQYAYRAVEAMPSNAGLYSNYALALLVARKSVEARAAAQKACALAPEDPISKRVLEKVDRVISGTEGWPDKIA
jgi:tetratricopeptide (TPR) repeat protein